MYTRVLYIKNQTSKKLRFLSKFFILSITKSITSSLLIFINNNMNCLNVNYLHLNYLVAFIFMLKSLLHNKSLLKYVIIIFCFNWLLGTKLF